MNLMVSNSNRPAEKSNIITVQSLSPMLPFAWWKRTTDQPLFPLSIVLPALFDLQTWSTVNASTCSILHSDSSLHLDVIRDNADMGNAAPERFVGHIKMFFCIILKSTFYANFPARQGHQNDQDSFLIFFTK